MMRTPCGTILWNGPMGVFEFNNFSKGTLSVGKSICESTCKFGIYKNYQKIKENDFVAITNVGAYGASLSSNYNTRPLVAEILVNKNKLRYIRKKQNLLKLINS